MSLSDALRRKSLIEIEQAVERQRVAGESLQASAELEVASPEAPDVITHEAPVLPTSVEETGLDSRWLLKFLLKAIYVRGIETVVEAEEHLKLHRDVLDAVFDNAKAMRLVEIVGLLDANASVYRYLLTSEGRQWALNALEESLYVGPAPVPLHDYQAQVARQSVASERVDRESLSRALSHLVVPEDIVVQLGPALNSAGAILLYGAPGNGKTSIAEALAGCFGQTIFVPHCIMVDGQVVRIFDPAIHETCDPVDSENGVARTSDPRWVHCRRPTVITGGELTIEMLDLTFDPVSKSYEAPAHIKATGGVFIIDDFGRQRVDPRELLNRWILPLDRRIDFLTLHTGKKIQMPFDQLVIFSTNSPPAEMMDLAALRRIEYKIHIPSPTPRDYETIFRAVCEKHGLELPGEVLAYVVETFYPNAGIARSGAHPKSVVEQLLARCAFERVPPEMSLDRVRDALKNLVVDDVPTHLA